MKNSIKIFTVIFSMLIGMSAYAKDYYVYVCAESEDEVALIRFDGKKAYVEKTIPVGVWPLEIEGPHGITVAPDGEHWKFQKQPDCCMLLILTCMVATAKQVRFPLLIQKK